jgi:hypothetical protein
MHPRQERDVRRDLVATAAFAVVFLLGFWGWSGVHERPQPGASPDAASHLCQHFLGRVYLSLQLFVLHPQGLPAHDPLQLDIARFLAPVLLVLATVSLLTSAFGTRARHLWLTRSTRHEIICGAGVHGQALANILRRTKPVVVIDIDPRAPGLQGQVHGRESRLIADTVNPDTLRRARVARAARLIAVTGDDVVNAQIASTVRGLCESEHWRLKPVVLVQAEDRVLARFLEDGNVARWRQEDRPPTGAPAEPERGEVLEVRTFGANTLAAVALFGGGAGNPTVRDSNAPLEDLEAADGDHLLLAGDHGILEAVVVTALRRARARRLRAGAGERTPRSLRITLIGVGAQRHRDAIVRRWQISPALIDLKATHLDPRTEAAVLSAPAWSEWRAEVSHALVACEDEHASIAVAVTLSRVLRPDVRLARVATQPENDLDNQLTARPNPQSAHIEVVPITDLAWGKKAERVNEVPPAGRLVAALVAEGFSDEEATAATTCLLAYEELDLQSDAAPRITPATGPIVDALLKRAGGEGQRPVPASALVSASLVPDLASRENLRRAAEQLAHDDSPQAFTAWCEYARLVPARNEELAPLQKLASDGGRRAVPLALRAAALPGADALDDLPADPEVVTYLRGRVSRRIAIFAGGAASMSDETQEAIRELLVDTLQHYDGVILTGGNDVGVCGAVRAAARLRGVPVIGYAPAGSGREGTRLRSTSTVDFSEAEPVAMWTDILVAARARGEVAGAATDVRLIAFPGGAITRTEIVLARALGAAVASLDPTEQLDEPLDELLPLGAGGVLTLPSDPMTLRAFLMWPNQPLDPARRVAAARELHDQYRREHRKHKPTDDPALAPWERLSSLLQGSNLAAVDDIPNKLHVVGKGLIVGGERLVLSDEEVKLLAEMEHGRYNWERLSAGWELGRTRALSRLVSPYLTRWDDLDEKVKQWDRDAVLALDDALQAAGWGVVSEQATMPGATRPSDGGVRRSLTDGNDAVRAVRPSA